jgi:hypothetical protein
LTEWQVFYSEEPFGFEADAFRSAQLAATIVNMTPRGRGARVFKATDFYHQPWKESGEGLTHEQREFIQKRKQKRVKKQHG